jgi:hypothetical protein
VQRGQAAALLPAIDQTSTDRIQARREETFDPAPAAPAGQISRAVRGREQAAALALAASHVREVLRGRAETSHGRGLPAETGRARRVAADRASRAETGQAPVEARAPRLVNSMTFLEWLALALRAAPQQPSSQIGQTWTAEASSDRVAPRVRDKTVAECSGHFRISPAVSHGLVKTVAEFNDHFQIGPVAPHGPVKTEAEFNARFQIGPAGTTALGRVAAAFNDRNFGQIDRRGPAKMAVVFSARDFALTDRTFDRIDRAFAPTGRSTSATSTLTTTITSSTGAQPGTTSPGMISTASAIVGRTR